jgi:hypothetical protein
MAIKFKEKQKEEAQAPFSKEELALLKNAEAHVDAEIEKQFKHGEISVDLLITSFEYDPTRKQRLALGHVRSRKLQKALEDMYKKAGWKITVKYDDGLDGPNMSGPDYWVLTGKRK